MILFLFYYRGDVHHEYAPRGQTVNKKYYQEVLYHLHDAAASCVRPTAPASCAELHHEDDPGFPGQA
jgi:hypothetical protein